MKEALIICGVIIAIVFMIYYSNQEDYVDPLVNDYNDCDCNCDDIESDYRYLKQNIEHELQYILNEPEYYSKKEILEIIEKVYDLVDN